MKKNRLAQEHSPYLRQHQANPVDWYPWGIAAFTKAKEENKPIFLSIGYSTCYWCHVMEKDSFERDDVAKVLNEDFVCIKVDREERPDIDSIYMDAVVHMTGHGGWPMSVFLTPELKPFYGGTFFPRDQFLSLLSQLSSAWKGRPEVLLSSAEELTRMLQRETPHRAPSELSESIFLTCIEQLEERFDAVYGGFSPAPKFPPGMTLSLLLRRGTKEKDSKALEMAEKTLHRMAQGGMYDHLGGGFHRYSTDKKWLVPHFEKMLYDNALLVPVYLDAFQITKNELYLSVARETLTYVLEEMSHDEGGYYSAEDAGEVGKEGEYYVWSENELKEILSDEEVAEIKRLYGVSSLGNFEDGMNILNFQDHVIWTDKYNGHARSALEKMLDVRAQRHSPHRDEKILTSWNGLMLSAMARGYRVTSDVAYLHSAERAAHFIRSQLCQGDELLHRHFEGNTGVPGMLDDYAFLIQGLLDLYEASGNSEWYSWANRLEETANRLFWNEESNCYYSTSEKDSSLLIRQKELHDGAEPAGNGVMAKNLVRLLYFEFEEERESRILSLLGTIAHGWERHPTAFSSSLLALDLFLGECKELVIVGAPENPEVAKLLKGMQEIFSPRFVVAWKLPGVAEEELPAIAQGKTEVAEGVGFYVCENRSCRAPVATAAEVFGLMGPDGFDRG